MTPQEIFSKVYNHLMTQHQQAAYPTDCGEMGCRYRTGTGLKCAVGCLISDENYIEEMEGYPAGCNIVADILRKEGVDMGEKITHELINALQSTHDAVEVCDWEHELSKLAEVYNLSIPS
jgi:hypothetical protein